MVPFGAPYFYKEKQMALKESYLRMLPTVVRTPIRKLFNSGASITNTIVGNVTGNVTGNIVATTLSGTLTGDVAGDIVGKHNLTLQSAEHGAGAISTAQAPVTYRGYGVNGDIITSIQFDLTDLLCKGDAALDAIGLASGAAYIGRYVTTTYGIVYKVELICLETPTETTATYTLDIDIGADHAADIAYDGAVDDVIVNTGGVAIGNSYRNLVPALTANDYIYIIEGDNAAVTGKYGGGQFILNLYGHPLLT
jgi:hypothetical protein